MEKQQTPAMSNADKHFKRREALKADAPKATADYYAAQQAVVERTRKLREERLAREAEAQENNVILLRSKKRI